MLVAQRPAHKRHGGIWEFPGGKTEPNESDACAAARELQEELGVQLVSVSPAVFEIEDAGSPFTIAFVPVEIQGDPIPVEHSGLVWGRPSDLAKLPFAPSDRVFLRWLLDSGGTPEHG